MSSCVAGLFACCYVHNGAPSAAELSKSSVVNLGMPLLETVPESFVA